MTFHSRNGALLAPVPVLLQARKGIKIQADPFHSNSLLWASTLSWSCVTICSQTSPTQTVPLVPSAPPRAHMQGCYSLRCLYLLPHHSSLTSNGIQRFPDDLYCANVTLFPCERHTRLMREGQKAGSPRDRHVPSVRKGREGSRFPTQSLSLTTFWWPCSLCRLQNDLDITTTHLLQPNAGGFLCRQVG